MSEQWQKVKEIFGAALRHDKEDRQAFLDQACAGDDSLRREVESLLSSYRDADSFLEDPPAGVVVGVTPEEKHRFAKGAEFGRYKIISHLGSGGMGEVYLAEDTVLKRRVAIKLINNSSSKSAEHLRRFFQEARAASALNHPNILTVHEIGEFDGTHFIAAEYVSGKTLRNRLKEGRIGLPEILDIAIQMTAALAAAHENGIIHRDVKPENVMLREDGLVKVLDFGLAKLTEKKTDQAVGTEAPTSIQVQTNPGVILGTARYMSPEQARGLQADFRTDIWSLGVCFYEMLAGYVPFTGETLGDSIVSILKSEPEPLTRSRPEIPAELERVVLKTLRKDREERYQHTKDLLVDLKDVRQDLEFEAKLKRSGATQTRDAQTASSSSAAAGGAYIANEIKKRRFGFSVAAAVLLVSALGLAYWFSADRAPNAAQIESIAVLPFVNESGNADMEFLSDGMTESLIGSLSQMPHLSVKARSSVFRYKDKDTTLPEIGRELKVQALLSGRIAQRGDQLMLSWEMIDVQTENRLAGGQYNRKTSEIVSLQSEIARDVSSKLRAKLSGADERKIEKSYTENPEAYQLYLRGKYHWNKFSEEGYKKAIEYFTQAIERDPNYALAYAGLSDTYMFLAVESYRNPREVCPQAKVTAEKALALDPELAEAHISIGIYNIFYAFDWPVAEKAFNKAIELNPRNADARHFYCHYLQGMGRTDEAIEQIRIALELDPFSLIVNTETGWGYYLARRFDEALPILQKTKEMDPNFFVVYYPLAQTYMRKGMHAEAIAELTRASEISGKHPQIQSQLAFAYALAGRRAEALKILQLLEEQAAREFLEPYFIAVIYVALGDRDKAFKWLDKAFEIRSNWLLFLKIEPELDPLRDDPRYAELVRKIGLQP